MQNPRFLAKDLSLQVTLYSGLEPCAMCPALPRRGWLTLKLYLTIFWGACGLLAVRMRVNSSFNSWGRQTPRGSCRKLPLPWPLRLAPLGVPVSSVQASDLPCGRPHFRSRRRWDEQRWSFLTHRISQLQLVRGSNRGFGLGPLISSFSHIRPWIFILSKTTAVGSGGPDLL